MSDELKYTIEWQELLPDLAAARVDFRYYGNSYYYTVPYILEYRGVYKACPDVYIKHNRSFFVCLLWCSDVR